MRRTGATLMQQLRIQPDLIDRCQNHYLGGSLVRRSYQQHDYAEEMRDAWSKLGTRLDDLMQKCSTRRAAEGRPEIRASLTTASR